MIFAKKTPQACLKYHVNNHLFKNRLFVFLVFENLAQTHWILFLCHLFMALSIFSPIFYIWHVSFSYYLEKNGKLLFSRTIFWFWSKVQCPAFDTIEVKFGCELRHQIRPRWVSVISACVYFLSIYSRKCWFLNNINRFLSGTLKQNLKVCITLASMCLSKVTFWLLPWHSSEAVTMQSDLFAKKWWSYFFQVSRSKRDTKL